MTGQALGVVSFSLIVSAVLPLRGVAVRQLTGGLARELSLFQLASLVSLPEAAAARTHLWALRLFLFNQNTWKGRSVCFSPRISLTDVMIKFALPMWPPKLTAVASGNSWTQASGNSWTQGRPTDPKESRASPFWPLFLQRKLESHTPILPLTRAGAWPRLSSSQSHYVHEHPVPWQDCPALDYKIHENSITMPGARYLCQEGPCAICSWSSSSEHPEDCSWLPSQGWGRG